MQMRGHWTKILVRGSLLLGLLCAAALIWLLVVLWYEYYSRREYTQDTAQRNAGLACKQIDTILHNIMTLAHDLAGQVGDHSLSRDEVEEKLRASLDLDANLRAVGVAFRPFAFGRQLRLYSVAYEVRDQGVTRINLDAEQDYTQDGPETAWYRAPIERGTGVWLEPTLGPRGNVIQATYALPFFGADANETPRGVVYIVYSGERLDRLLNRLDLGSDGYSFILSRDGYFVSHPNRGWVDSKQTLFDVCGDLQDSRGPELARRALRGEAVQGQTTDPLTQSPAYMLYRPIQAADWALGVVVTEHVLTSSPASRRQYIGAGVMLVAALAFFSLALLRVHEGSTRALWAWVTLISLLSSLCIIYIAFMVRAAPVESFEQIANKASLHRFQVDYNSQALLLRDKLPVYVPTGIYVQSATFAAATEVRLTGYVWQKYYPGVHDGLVRGFVFPESERSFIEAPQVFREADGVERLIWRFTVFVNQAFDYSRYPFSRENVWIQLWHKDFMNDVVLTPDLDAYRVTNPRALCGLKTGLELPGWNIDRTYFSYRTVRYQTSFGAPDYSGLTNFPELYFNIIVTKQLVGPAIAHYLPITITYVLLFTMLMLTTRKSTHIELFGFSTMNVVAASAGFFLVLIFSHVGLRSSLSATGIVYVEYFYCVTYAMILYLVGNSILFASTDLALIQYRNNLLPKLLFWPLSQVAVLAVTALSFY